MLHEGARTRFIISGLTRAIQLLFSIRQGDPIAMLLYIIYVEPLLLALEKRMTGLQVAAGIGKSLEAYCDGINIITENLEDLDVVSEVVGKFEKVSGAILSRNKKCKVLGLETGRVGKIGLSHGLNLLKQRKSSVFSYAIHTKKNWN